MTDNENHRRPLAPGEIRTHTVGARTFRVMHVSGGSFAQASVRADGEPATVLKTDRFESTAVRAYADAIEQAESDAADVDTEDEPMEPLTAEGTEALRVRAGFAPSLQVDKAIAELQRFEEIDQEAVARGESANWWERGAQVDYNLPMGADPALVYGERGPTDLLRCPTCRSRQPNLHPAVGGGGEVTHLCADPFPGAPAPTLADDVAALREKIELLAESMHEGTMGPSAAEVQADLDRIAGAVPQRATWNGAPWWQHKCGYVTTFEPAPEGGGCDACESGSDNAGDWRALYTLGGE